MWSQRGTISMFGLFGKKKKLAELSEKARKLAETQVSETREERLKEQGLLYSFKERSARDRRSGKDRRHFHLAIQTERRQSDDRRIRLDRRDSMRLESEASRQSRITPYGLAQEHEHQLRVQEAEGTGTRGEPEKD